MSAIPASLAGGHAHADDSHGHGDNYLNHQRGILSWLLTLDHKRIGLMYMMAVLTAFAIGGIFAILLRTMLWHPAPFFGATPEQQQAATKSYELYNHFFTLHGAVMVFLFMIPAIPAI